MADTFVPTDEQLAENEAWLKTLPPRVREVAERFPRWRLFRLKETNQRVIVWSFDEHKDGGVTLRVDVLGMFNSIDFERRVFGIDPDDLEECDLPGPDEKLGATLQSDEEIDAFIARLRELRSKGEPWPFR